MKHYLRNKTIHVGKGHMEKKKETEEKRGGFSAMLWNEKHMKQSEKLEPLPLPLADSQGGQRKLADTG